MEDNRLNPPPSTEHSNINQQTGPGQSQPESSKTDVLGIVSIILAFIGMQLIGFVVGLIGVSKAKKEGYSPILSRIGWILNLAFGIIAILIALVILAAIPKLQEHQRETIQQNNDVLVN